MVRLIYKVIYKPSNGERPLWDFPSGLYRREIASFLVAQLIGWDIVPPTVKTDGPFGVGSLQLFIPCDFEEHYFHILEDPEIMRRCNVFVCLILSPIAQTEKVVIAFEKTMGRSGV